MTPDSGTRGNLRHHGVLALPEAVGSNRYFFRDLLSEATMNENGCPGVKK